MPTIVEAHLLNVGSVTEIMLPHESKPVSVGLQGGDPYLWEMHTSGDTPAQTRTFLAVLDDVETPEGWLVYVGTFQSQPDEIAHHVFEVRT